MTLQSVGICVSEYRFMKLLLFLSRPTGGVTGGWWGNWLGNGNLPKFGTSSKKRAESESFGIPPENENVLFPQRNRANESILRIVRPLSRTKQWRHALMAVPWCTLVSGPDDSSIGGGRPEPV
jgi:hypothetical protein